MLSPQSKQSIFDRAWQRYSSGNNRHIITIFEEIEQQLGLTPGFLSSDELIMLKIYASSPKTPYPASKIDMLRIVLCALSDIKIVDLSRNKVYGTFSDDYLAYRDDQDNLLYRDSSPTSIYSPYLDSPSSAQTRFYESDIDDTSSLMVCDSVCIERSPSIIDLPPDDLEDKFKLHKVLEDLRTRHAGINLSFRTIDAKLANIKEQNGKDLDFLDKLTANSELIRDRMHDMRSEIDELTSAVEDLKKEAEGKQAVPPPTKKHNIIDLCDSDSDTLHSGSPRLEAFSAVLGSCAISTPEEDSPQLPPRKPSLPEQQEHKCDDTDSEQVSTVPTRMIEAETKIIPTAVNTNLRILVVVLVALLAYWIRY